MLRGTSTAGVVGLILVGACAMPPLSPGPAPPLTLPPSTGTISGVVFERTSNGPVPVVGVEVLCNPCENGGHAARFTDSAGAYAFGAERNGVYPLHVAKQGYRLAQPDWVGPGGSGWLGSVNVTVYGDTRLDIELIRQ